MVLQRSEKCNNLIVYFKVDDNMKTPLMNSKEQSKYKKILKILKLKQNSS